MAEPRRRPPPPTVQAAKQTRIHYLIVGLAVGGLWLLDRDKSLLYHAVQMTAAAGEHPPHSANTLASSAPNWCWWPWPSARNGCWPP
jgi:hypothetical protein